MKIQVQYLEISSDESGQRLDNFLLAKFKNVPKSHLYRIIRKGEVRVNGKRVSPRVKLVEHDSLRLPPVHVQEKSCRVGNLLPTRLSDKIKQCILYEDDDLIVINKPSGIPVHGGNEISWGIIEALRVLYPQKKLELVHRLDKETSGCLLVSKNRKTLVSLHALLRENKIKKTYLALLKGKLKKKQPVSLPLAKYILSSGERFVHTQASGKLAQTVFVPIEHFKDATLVQALPQTGRTHQIRVHAEFIEHPIAGDTKYGDKMFNAPLRRQGLKRLFLHAQAISFTLDGKSSSFEAPLSVELTRFLEKLN